MDIGYYYARINKEQRNKYNSLVEELEKEIQKLAGAYSWRVKELEKEIQELKAKLEKAVEVIKFYGDEYNFYGEVKECDLKKDPYGDTVREMGSLANEFLKELEGEE